MGNNAQTEIDIQIEKCKFYKRNAENHLSYWNNELGFISENITEISDHLASLRETRSIVSMREFFILRSKLDEFRFAKEEVLIDLSNVKKEIEGWNEKIDRLQVDRQRLSTKILEVDFGKRKRSKNRK